MHYAVLRESSNVNEARYQLFTGKSKFPDPYKLPPTSNTLRFHLHRANYQTYKWRQALERGHSTWILKIMVEKDLVVGEQLYRIY